MDGVPVPPGDGWGGLPLFLMSMGDGEEGVQEYGDQERTDEYLEINPSVLEDSLFPTQASVRSRLVALFFYSFQ